MSLIQAIKEVHLSRSWWMWGIGLGLLALLTGDTTKRPAYMNLVYVEAMWFGFNIWISILAVLLIYAKTIKNPVAKLWAVGGIFLFLLVSVTATLVLAVKADKLANFVKIKWFLNDLQVA